MSSPTMNKRGALDVPKTMTKAEALKHLALINSDTYGGDTGDAHWNADQVLCALLRSLGHEDVVEAWMEVPKWYA